MRFFFLPFLRSPRLSLTFALLLLVLLGYHSGGFRQGSALRDLLETDGPFLAAFEELERHLSVEEYLLIDIGCGEVFTNSCLEALRLLGDDLLGQKWIREVKSITHTYFPIRRGFSFEFEPFVRPLPLSDRDLEGLKGFSLSHPLVRGVLVSPDSRHALISATFEGSELESSIPESVRQNLELVIDRNLTEEMSFRMLALPFAEAEIRRLFKRDSVLFSVAAITTVSLLLWIFFRSWRTSVCIFVNLALYLSLFQLLASVVGQRFHALTVQLYPLLIGVQLTLLVHISSSFLVFRRSTPSALKAIECMLGQIFRSCLYASITTIAGLLSLSISDLNQVRVFGQLGAVGVAIGFLIAFGPGLSLLLLFYSDIASRIQVNSAVETEPGPGGFGWTSILDFIVGHRMGILLATAVFLLAAIPGFFRIQTEFRFLELLNRNSETRRSVEFFDRTYGGLNLLKIQVDSGLPTGVKESRFLDFLSQLHAHAEGLAEVSAVYSYSSVLAMINQIWEGRRAGSLKLPDNPFLLNLYQAALNSHDLPLSLYLNDKEFQSSFIYLRTHDLPSSKVLKIIDEVIALGERIKPESVILSAADGIQTLYESNQVILQAQVRSIAITVASIFCALLLLWRSIFLASLSVTLLTIPACILLAVAGYASIPINAVTVTLGAVTLAVAVDDIVHFVTFWMESRRNRSSAEALLDTFSTKGPPILCTSVILVCVFSSMALASFPPLVHFGLLASVALISILGAVFLLLPNLLRKQS